MDASNRLYILTWNKHHYTPFATIRGGREVGFGRVPLCCRKKKKESVGSPAGWWEGRRESVCAYGGGGKELKK